MPVVDRLEISVSPQRQALSVSGWAFEFTVKGEFLETWVHLLFAREFWLEFDSRPSET